MSQTLLTGARVVTMTDDGPDAAIVDVLIDDDHIVAIGADLESSNAEAEVVELGGRIIIPGLVNAHLHTWQSALRCVGVDWSLLDYVIHTHNSIASHYRPDDLYIGTLFGALSQIDSGTTTVGDWSHNLSTSADTDAALAGLRESGIRAVFFDGSGYRDQAPHPLRDFDRIRADLGGEGGLIGAGLAIKGPQYSSPEDALADLRAANERGSLVSMHHSGGAPGPAWRAAADADVLGPNTNVVHGGGLDDAWLADLSDRGVTFTISPESELRQGPEELIVHRLLRHGVAPSIGTDIDTVVPGEVLTAARILLAHQRGVAYSEGRPSAMSAGPFATAMEALSWATVEGARALGLADQAGRLAPGMKADLVVIDATAVNLWPAHDAIAAALHANGGNIEAVMINGRWRKRDHRLLGIDLETLRDDMATSARHVLSHLESI